MPQKAVCVCVDNDDNRRGKSTTISAFQFPVSIIGLNTHMPEPERALAKVHTPLNTHTHSRTHTHVFDYPSAVRMNKSCRRADAKFAEAHGYTKN